jgi:hypothetical protein
VRRTFVSTDLRIVCFDGIFLGPTMKLKEEEINYLEEHIPELAAVAFKQAYWAALASGSSVLMSEDGNLVEIFPDGHRRIIKPLAPRIAVKRGQRFVLP